MKFGRQNQLYIQRNCLIKIERFHFRSREMWTGNADFLGSCWWGKKSLWPEGLQSDYHLLLAICLLPRSTGPVETRDL